MVPCTIDRIHYARWATIHLKDLHQLSKNCPKLWAEFNNGKFTVRNSGNPISSIATDQPHEQENLNVKGCTAGFKGLTTNAKALQKFMVTGPAVAALIAQYEESRHEVKGKKQHDYECTVSMHKTFLKEVQCLLEVLADMGYPFLQDSDQLLSLHTKRIMEDEVIRSTKEVREIGETLFQEFADDRLIEKTKSLYDTISQNNLPLMTHKKSRKSKAATKLSATHHNFDLFS